MANRPAAERGGRIGLDEHGVVDDADASHRDPQVGKDDEESTEHHLDLVNAVGVGELGLGGIASAWMRGRKNSRKGPGLTLDHPGVMSPQLGGDRRSKPTVLRGRPYFSLYVAMTTPFEVGTLSTRSKLA